MDHPRQLNIFEALTAVRQEDRDGPGSMACLEELKGALNLALKRSPLSRHQVAGQMSHLLNTQITKEMIDSWTADGKARHIPAEWLPAFCAAAADDGPLLVLNRKRRLFTFQEPEALRSEIHRMREEARGLTQEIRKRERLLQLFNSGLPGPEKP